MLAHLKSIISQILKWIEYRYDEESDTNVISNLLQILISVENKYACESVTNTGHSSVVNEHPKDAVLDFCSPPHLWSTCSPWLQIGGTVWPWRWVPRKCPLLLFYFGKRVWNLMFSSRNTWSLTVSLWKCLASWTWGTSRGWTTPRWSSPSRSASGENPV